MTNEQKRTRIATNGAPVYNIVVLGTGAVGKSAITLRVVKDKFDPNYDPTIEDSYTKAIEVDGEVATLDILDTAGQEQFLALQENWIKQGLAYLIVYAVDSQLSFKAVQSIYEKIKTIKEGQEHHVILFGNKVDLGDARREVQTQEGQHLAKTWKVAFMEGSALSSKNVVEAFEELVRQCRNFQNQDKKNNSQNSGGCCTIL